MYRGQDFFAYRPEGKSYALAVYQPDPKPAGLLYFMSRPLLEHCLRQRVEGLANVETRYRALVGDVMAEDGQVTGLAIDGGEQVAADLVVDASGRNARTLGWLAALGFESPPESVVNCDFAYASAVVQPADPESLGGAGFFVLPEPDGPHTSRGAYLVRIEGGRWIAGLGGRFGDYPPTDVEAWREFGRTLSHPAWDKALDTAEMVGKPVGFRFPAFGAPALRTSRPISRGPGPRGRLGLSLQPPLRPGDVGRRLPGASARRCPRAPGRDVAGPDGTGPRVLSRSLRGDPHALGPGCRRRLPRRADDRGFPHGGAAEPGHVPAGGDPGRHGTGHGRAGRRHLHPGAAFVGAAGATVAHEAGPGLRKWRVQCAGGHHRVAVILGRNR